MIPVDLDVKIKKVLCLHDLDLSVRHYVCCKGSVIETKLGVLDVCWIMDTWAVFHFSGL